VPRRKGESPTLLSGFGRATPSAATLVDVDEEQLAAAIKDLPARGGIARGLGRSYGDPAQNAGGHVLRLAPDNESIVIDDAAGTVTVGAGVSIDELLNVIVPRGWFVPVTPGTRFVTVGGAIASDIHGKNHHLDGSFGNYVTRLRLMLADTTVVEVGPDRDPDLFWATVAGMGLTGVILDATFRLLPIETSRISVDTYRLPNLDEVMSRMVESEADFRYSVAWIDLLATGKHFGRGVLTNGEHATHDQLPPQQAIAPLAYDSRQLVTIPPLVPSAGVINRASVAAFNEVWYRKAPRRRQGELQSIPTYFHPLDLVGDWNRVYGRQGFLQYQFVVPYEAEPVMRTIIERLSAARLPIFLVVLKRFGPGNPAPLSFPTSGWQLAIDIGANRRGLADLLRHFDAMVLDAGGRHYLAKDYQTTPEAIRRGYPRLDDWLTVRDRVDPAGVWASDLSRRLGLTPDRHRHSNPD
jgi:decaprenylphospho-beta-D-ribofuranose 2-oxidase